MFAKRKNYLAFHLNFFGEQKTPCKSRALFIGCVRRLNFYEITLLMCLTLHISTHYFIKVLSIVNNSGRFFTNLVLISYKAPKYSVVIRHQIGHFVQCPRFARQ
jgi:hypothetical protein